MRLRHRYLACLLLLLGSLSAAEGHALRGEHLTPGGRYISMLLSQRAAAADSAEAFAAESGSYKVEDVALAPAALALHSAAWTMRPPAAHTAALEAATARRS